MNEDEWIRVQDHCFNHGIYWSSSGTIKFIPDTIKVSPLSIIIAIKRNKVTLMAGPNTYLDRLQYYTVEEFMKHNLKELLFDILL